MNRRTFQPVESKRLIYNAPGLEEVPEFTTKAGDFFLVHHKKNPISRLIRWGQGLRIHGEDRKYCHWNHAVLVIDDQGNCIEAQGKGVTRTHVDAYANSEYVFVSTGAIKHDRDQVIAFAEQVLGLKYGFFTIASIAFCVLTGGKLIFSLENQFICSGLVARAQERAGALFNKNPDHIMPADLAKYYQVEFDLTD